MPVRVARGCVSLVSVRSTPLVLSPSDRGGTPRRCPESSVPHPCPLSPCPCPRSLLISLAINAPHSRDDLRRAARSGLRQLPQLCCASAVGPRARASSSRAPTAAHATRPCSNGGENIPVLRLRLALGGRCRTCNAAHPLALSADRSRRRNSWGTHGLASLSPSRSSRRFTLTSRAFILCSEFGESFSQFILYWLLVALWRPLDAENLWLPDILTIPGIVIGLITILIRASGSSSFLRSMTSLRQRPEDDRHSKP